MGFASPVENSIDGQTRTAPPKAGTVHSLPFMRGRRLDARAPMDGGRESVQRPGTRQQTLPPNTVWLAAVVFCQEQNVLLLTLFAL